MKAIKSIGTILACCVTGYMGYAVFNYSQVESEASTVNNKNVKYIKENVDVAQEEVVETNENIYDPKYGVYNKAVIDKCMGDFKNIKDSINKQYDLDVDVKITGIGEHSYGGDDMLVIQVYALGDFYEKYHLGEFEGTPIIVDDESGNEWNYEQTLKSIYDELNYLGQGYTYFTGFGRESQTIDPKPENILEGDRFGSAGEESWHQPVEPFNPDIEIESEYVDDSRYMGDEIELNDEDNEIIE